MTISRRTVLGAGAALPFANVPTAHAAPTASGPSASDWVALDTALRGSIALPGSTSYGSRAPLFDPRWDVRRPAAVARVLLTQDVASCIEFARDHGLKVTGRSGGHSYTGASATTGALVIDTRSLRTVDLTPHGSRATIGAGANLYSVYSTLSARGQTIPGGSCPTVGIAGLGLVGGLGVDSRRVGLTSDRLVRATVVDGRGRIRRVDADSDADLFWALRGGGPGIGIVTSLTYRTVGAPSRGFFTMSFSASQAARALRQWGTWMQDQPGDTWANAHVDSSGGSLSVRVFGVCPAGREDARASSLRQAIGDTPARTSTTTRSYLEGVEYLGGDASTPRTRFVAGSDVLQVVTSGVAEAVVAALRSVPSGPPHRGPALRHRHGHPLRPYNGQPEQSKIPGVRLYHRQYGRQICPNGNTLEDSLDQYDSMIKEKTLATSAMTRRSARPATGSSSWRGAVCRFGDAFPSVGLTALPLMAAQGRRGQKRMLRSS